MSILGISCYYHDSAAALLRDDGTIAAAAQEERFTRKKHDSGFPVHAAEYCLEEAGLTGKDLKYVVFYEQPLAKFERIVDSHLSIDDPPSFESSFRLWLGGKLYQSETIIEELHKIDPGTDWKSKLLFTEHHASHAASAFFPSPFERAAVLTLDGVGEHATASIGIGSGNDLKMVKEMHFPHSLGLFYSAFTHFTGFRVNSGEYKMMGLAPYGQPKYVDIIRDNLIDLHEDGSFWINPKYFDAFVKDQIINEQFDELFGFPRRAPGDILTREFADIAASAQKVTEDAVLNIVQAVRRDTGEKNLCLAGGVALNCVANGRIQRESKFEGFWIQPAAGDAGGALGAALYIHHVHENKPRQEPGKNMDAMQGAYLGPGFDEQQIEATLKSYGAKYTHCGDEKIADISAEHLANGKTLAWFQGRMEFGPRSLGARSILGDPRSRETQRDMNLRIKKRESFRPFAPAVLEEKVQDWFETGEASPYMLIVSHIKAEKRKQQSDKAKSNGEAKRFTLRPPTDHSELPAITHADYSARVQTVHQETNPLFHKVLSKFDELTGCPVLVNTSFNVRGEPIVCDPADAFRCFMNTELDYLAIGPFLVSRKEQDPLLVMRLAQEFPPD